jgi:hypothetical protein
MDATMLLTREYNVRWEIFFALTYRKITIKETEDERPV